GETWLIPSGVINPLITGSTYTATPVNNPAVDSQFSNWQNEVFGSTVGANTYTFTYTANANSAVTWTNAGAGNSGDIVSVLDTNSGIGYSTIQAAVTAANPSDTIVV